MQSKVCKQLKCIDLMIFLDTLSLSSVIANEEHRTRSNVTYVIYSLVTLDIRLSITVLKFKCRYT